MPWFLPAIYTESEQGFNTSNRPRKLQLGDCDATYNLRRACDAGNGKVAGVT
jgi:hypothetical protein